MRGALLVLFSALVGGLAGWISAWTFYQRVVLDQLSVLTPVVVLDGSAAVSHLTVHSSPEEVRAAIDQIGMEAQRLQSKGFLVLKKEAVAAAPEFVYVRVGEQSVRQGR